MKPATKTQESWISANWLSSQLDINRGTIHYYAVKLKLRYFKWHGARYLEQQDAICLVKRIAYQYQLDKDFVEEVKATIENYQCSM